MELIEIEKSEFVFVQKGEFSIPHYALMIDGEECGYIDYVGGCWQGGLAETYQYSADIFGKMAEKMDELNESLIEQRKEFFGLI